MARKTDYGSYILSAGEIGSYTVCPKSWQLKTIKKVSTLTAESVKKGSQLHEQWARDYDEAVYLARAVKLVTAVLVLTAVVFLIL